MSRSDSVSAAVRRIIAANGNGALRMAALYERVRQEFPDLSKTHFREHIVRQMVLRHEVRGEVVLQCDASSTLVLSKRNLR